MKHKEKPLAEITLRKYEKPFQLKGRELVKKLCLSLGLLQPGDGRDVIVDVFSAVFLSNSPQTTKDIEEFVKTNRKNHELSHIGVTPANLRRQIKRLKDYSLLERAGNSYHLAEHLSLPDIFTEKIEKFYLPILTERIKEYCHAAEKWKNGKLPQMQQ